MTPIKFAAMLDHPAWKPEAAEHDVRTGADIVHAWSIGDYCAQPCWVTLAARSLAGTTANVVSVAGFPHGNDRFEVKAHAAAPAVADGVAEIDMVQNVGALKSGCITLVATDIEAVVRAVSGIPVKVILGTAALTEDGKLLACRVALAAGAAFVKPSTGVHPAGGATVADVRLLRAAVGPAVGVKASGDIRNLADALAMREAGASRIGTSGSAAIPGELGTA